MTTCEDYSGRLAIVAHYGDNGATYLGSEWTRADPLVHIYGDVAANRNSDFILAMYRLREKCPEHDAWHALRLER